jgi:hypothetical protein
VGEQHHRPCRAVGEGVAASADSCSNPGDGPARDEMVDMLMRSYGGRAHRPGEELSIQLDATTDAQVRGIFNHTFRMRIRGEENEATRAADIGGDAGEVRRLVFDLTKPGANDLGEMQSILVALEPILLRSDEAAAEFCTGPSAWSGGSRGFAMVRDHLASGLTGSPKRVAGAGPFAGTGGGRRHGCTDSERGGGGRMGRGRRGR